MSQKCQYEWRTTAKKGTLCGRKLLTGDKYCWQHSHQLIKEYNKKSPEISTPENTEINSNKRNFIQLENTADKKIINKKSKKNSSSSSLSSSESSNPSLISSSSLSESL